jgi:hypothetical protein
VRPDALGLKVKEDLWQSSLSKSLEKTETSSLWNSAPLRSPQGNVQVVTRYTEQDQDPMTTVTTVSVVTSAVQSGLQAAERIRNWWQRRPQSENQVTIRTARGRIIDLSSIDQKQLEIVLTEDE